ncbi:hypothetical protein V6N11_034921 [Hibiscus sabdariffa]|uniref:RNase H type-1 domain-containing protein n=1 Tax=Hibiscus sabdariffa TaxID=183260 RepID=A0ABR2NDY3_9ROSI
MVVTYLLWRISWLRHLPFSLIYSMHQRNEIVHERSACSTAKVSTFILAFLLELESLVDIPAPKTGIKDVKWFPPDGDIIKINFDASFHICSKSSVSRVVARNSQGLIVAACTHPHSRVVDAFIVEALAYKLAVTFAIDLGFHSVMVEGDSLSVIKKLCHTPPRGKSVT